VTFRYDKVEAMKRTPHYLVERRWLNFYIAAEEVLQRLGVSGGVAQKMLREACAHGDIRSQREPYDPVTNEGQGPPEFVKPSEWAKDQVDLLTDDDGCINLVDVDEDDFRHWLDQQKPSPQKPPPKSKSKRGKVPVVMDYLKEMFPRGVPDPARCPRKGLLADLRVKDARLRSLDDATLQGAIDAIRNDPK
jgi:hypothetical protein